MQHNQGTPATTAISWCYPIFAVGMHKYMHPYCKLGIRDNLLLHLVFFACYLRYLPASLHTLQLVQLNYSMHPQGPAVKQPFSYSELYKIYKKYTLIVFNNIGNI